jgi:tetratricopeptide (TPR) repeat protein
MNLHRRLLPPAALLALALAGGCDRPDTLTFTAETSEPHFERAAQMVRQGRTQEALSAYLKVIAKRGDEAPESHLEAAAIYKQHIKDYLAAIYHFRKYLELQPNSRQAELVKQQIEACKREFARSLPAHPLNDASVKLGYMEQLDRLQRENDQLKAEIAALRAGLPTSANPYRGGFEIPLNSGPTTGPAPRAVAVESGAGDTEGPPISRAPLAAEGEAQQGQNALRVAAPPPAPRTGPAAPAPTATAAGKKHTVAAGDTLSNISQRYYGTRTRAGDIKQANRELLKGGDRLSIGMELRLP